MNREVYIAIADHTYIYRYASLHACVYCMLVCVKSHAMVVTRRTCDSIKVMWCLKDLGNIALYGPPKSFNRGYSYACLFLQITIAIWLPKNIINLILIFKTFWRT